MFLMESYMETADFGYDSHLYEQSKKENTILTEKTTNFLEESIIGQIVKFIFGLINTSLNTAKNMKNTVQKNLAKISSSKLNSSTSDDDNVNGNENELMSHKYHEGLKFLLKHSAHIEIVRNDKVEKLHFLKLPFCACLTNNEKGKFNEEVDRSSTNSKISSLLSAAYDIIEKIKYEEKLQIYFNKNLFLALFANYVKLWKDIAFILSVLINIFIICSYSSENIDPNITDPFTLRMYVPKLFLNQNATNTSQSFQLMGIAMTACSSFVVSFYLCKRAPLIIKNSWQSLSYLKPKKILAKFFYFIIKCLYVLLQVLKNFDIVYYLAYGAFSILGVVVHPFFFAFHLSEILFR